MLESPQINAHGSETNRALTAMVYVRDQESEAVLRQCLSNLAADTVSYSRGGIETAISDLVRRPSPQLLVVDVSGAEDPAAHIRELSQVCESNTGVIALGDRNDISLYRSLKDAGIVEYFYKPLVDNLVQRACTAVLSGEREHHASHTGKLIFVLGMRGGVGATSIAIWAAWHLAEMRHRRALLVDLDLWGGDTALQLDVLPNHALREALEKPDRVDDLFLERGVIHAGPRLDILAALEPLDQFTSLRDDAVLSLLTNVLSQYRYVFVDVPQALAPQLVQALQLPSIILLVSDGSLVSARDVARWRQQIGPDNAERQTLHVVNKAGALGSLPTEAYVRAVGQAPDIIIPYQHEIGVAATLGAKGLTQDGAMERALAPLFKHIAGETASESRSIFSRLFA